MEISRQLANYLEGKRCSVYAAPFDVRLFEKDGDAPEKIEQGVFPRVLMFGWRQDSFLKCYRDRKDVELCH